MQVRTEIITPMKKVTACLIHSVSFNIGTFYIRMVTVVTNIYLLYTLYIINVP
jgi:hypothetical protein